MKKIKINVSWTGNNFCCGFGMPGVGAVLATNKTLDGLKAEFEDSLKFHIEGCVEDGDDIPQYLIDGNYEIEYNLDSSALLREAETFTTLAAISRATGINQKQLSHYANGVKTPRKEQRSRIIAGLHEIGRRALALI